MLQKKQFKGSVRGRDKIYPFNSLGIGDCLTINPSGNIQQFRHKVSAAFYQWKKYNGYNWSTAVRIENDKISVYRMS
jgi:hypothetical protein